MEHNGLAGQTGVIVLGEGDVQVLLVAGLGAHQLLLEAGDKGTGTQLQVIVLALAALKGLAIVKALKVDDHGVAVLGGAVHADQTGGPVDVGLEFLIHVLVGDLGHVLGGGQALIGAQLHLGTDRDQSLKGQAVLAHLNDLDLGVTHVIQLLLLHGLGISAGIDLVDGLFIEHAGAIHALDDLPGGLALAEAGDADALAVLLIGLLNGSLKRVGLHLDGQLDGALLFLLNTGDLHFVKFLLSACHTLQRRNDIAFLLSSRYSIRYPIV